MYPGDKLRFIYPNYSMEGIEGEGHKDYAVHSGQIVTVQREVADAFHDGDGNPCRGFEVRADDGWTGLVWPGELQPPSIDNRTARS